MNRVLVDALIQAVVYSPAFLVMGLVSRWLNHRRDTDPR